MRNKTLYIDADGVVRDEAGRAIGRVTWGPGSRLLTYNTPGATIHSDSMIAMTFDLSVLHSVPESRITWSDWWTITKPKGELQ